MLELKDVTYGYDDHVIFDHMSVTFPSRGLYGITGPSGCGKSTLLNLINGLARPQAGEVLFKGERVTDNVRRDHFSQMRQTGDLVGSLNVRDNITLGCRLSRTGYPKTSFERIVRTLDLGRLLKRKPHELSTGQAKRVAIARGLLKDADILLCDEPTGALHSHQAEAVMALLKEAAKDRLVIVVSHQKGLIMRYADVVLEVKDHTLTGMVEQEDVPVERHAKRKHWSLLPLAVHEVMSQRSRLLSLITFQVILMTSLFMMGSGLYGLNEAINASVNENPRKAICTVERRDGETFDASVYTSLRPVLAAYTLTPAGTSFGEAEVTSLVESADHIVLTKGRLPENAGEVVITASLARAWKGEIITCRAGQAVYTFRVCGVIEEGFFTHQIIYVTRSFVAAHPELQSHSVYEAEGMSESELSSVMGESYDVTNDVLLEQEAYGDVIRMGRIVALVFIGVSVLVSVSLIVTVLGALYLSRARTHAMMVAMGLKRYELRGELVCESLVMALVISCTSMAIFLTLREAINTMSDFITTYHFAFALPTWHVKGDVMMGGALGYTLFFGLIGLISYRSSRPDQIVALLREED